MRWKGGRRSQNIEDVRGKSAPSRGGLPLHLLTSKSGLLILAVAAGAYFMGVDPRLILSVLSGSSQQTTQTSQAPISPEQQQLGEFVAVVLADTEDTWRPLFQQRDLAYQDPTLVLFSDAVNSACGFAQAAMGPFYCPADQKVYIDLSFYRDLKERHDAPGDFAQAYVIAHEVGHHVQTLLGISAQVQQKKRTVSQVEANQLQVRMELQADCYAGLWAHHAEAARQILEDGDIDEALNAASQIGDDTLQQKGQGKIVPESFTHGTAAQRSRWFKRGFELGSVDACDTFSIKTL
jgi:hypothetical protein